MKLWEETVLQVTCRFYIPISHVLIIHLGFSLHASEHLRICHSFVRIFLRIYMEDEILCVRFFVLIPITKEASTKSIVEFSLQESPFSD